MLTQPSPNPVITRMAAPMTDWVVPVGSALAVSRWMWSTVRATYTAVTMISAMVRYFCSRMISSKPMIPAPTITSATTTNAATFVPSPWLQPSRSKTVAVASVDSATSTVSQPTSRT